MTESLPRIPEFVLPDELSLAQLESCLETVFTCSAVPSKPVRRTLYDSFDWRVYADGGLVELTRNHLDRHFDWIALDQSSRLGPVPVRKPPRFAEDVPPGLLRQRLAGALAMRALMPKLEFESETETLNLLNGEGKTVVRISIDRNLTVRRASQ